MRLRRRTRVSHRSTFNEIRPKNEIRTTHSNLKRMSGRTRAGRTYARGKGGWRKHKPGPRAIRTKGRGGNEADRIVVDGSKWQGNRGLGGDRSGRNEDVHGSRGVYMFPQKRGEGTRCCDPPGRRGGRRVAEEKGTEGGAPL